MGAIHDVVKANQLFTVTDGDSVAEAARFMTEHEIGAAPVLKGTALAGIFSERDIMTRVVATGRDPQRTKVAEVMTRDVLTVSPYESVDSCMVLMKMHGIRHLPIVEGTHLLGVVSLRDILLHEVTEMDGEVRAMRAYLQSGM